MSLLESIILGDWPWATRAFLFAYFGSFLFELRNGRYRMAVIVDFPGTGEMINPQGNIPVLIDQDALNNAINLWICSFRGERLYRPHDGGIVADHLLKPMGEERSNDMRSDIIDGLAHQFTPYVAVSECTVTPDFERNIYWVMIAGYCPSLRVSIYNKIGLRPLV